MTGILSDADLAQMGDSMEAARLRNAFEEFIKHHKQVQAERDRYREAIEKAPHEPDKGCGLPDTSIPITEAARLPDRPFSGEPDGSCFCWKAAALEEKP